MLTKNTAVNSGAEIMSMNFVEFINGRRKETMPTETTEEIIEKIGDRLDALGGNQDECL